MEANAEVFRLGRLSRLELVAEYLKAARYRGDTGAEAQARVMSNDQLAAAILAREQERKAGVAGSG